MREIKFRVWDKELKQMIHTKDLEWYDDSFGFRLEKHTEDIEHKLMQYIGLKDAEGNKIYEGDIVEAWSEGVKARGEVKQRIDGCWIIYPAYQKSKSWILSPNDNGDTSVKVIGNIYENPELLG